MKINNQLLQLELSRKKLEAKDFTFQWEKLILEKKSLELKKNINPCDESVKKACNHVDFLLYSYGVLLVKKREVALHSDTPESVVKGDFRGACPTIGRT